MKFISRAAAMLLTAFIVGLIIYVAVPMFDHTLIVCNHYWAQKIEIKK